MFPPWNKRARQARMLLTRTVAAFLAVFCFPPLCAMADFDPAATRSSEMQAPALLKFQYRLFPAAEVEKAEVTQHGKPLESRHTAFANNPLNTCAILILVDTSIGSSHAPRERTLADNKQFILSLLAKAQPGDLIGVCAFANELAEVAPVGSPSAEIRGKIAPLKANGLGTRIYRQGMNAIEKLAAVQASRKALVILSDGKDEDNGFTREDLVKAALKQGVMVFAMGCPETGTDIPALGNLEKIAGETRALYARALIGSADSGERQRADADFAQAVLDSVASGGEVVAALDAADPAAEILIQLTTKGGETLRFTHARPATAQPASQPAQSPEAVSAESPDANVSPTSTVNPSAEKSPAHAPAAADGTLKLFSAANLVSACSVILLVVAVLILRRRKMQPTPPAPGPVAYLQMQDAESKRLPLSKTAIRIGRRLDNDIIFANTSISGYHAEIHARRDGTYHITDLGSGNGVSVNEQRVAQSELNDGDLVELGEVRFRFFRG